MNSNWIHKIVQIIVEHYAPDEVILFGSHAKGKQDIYSDIDLLIIRVNHLPRELRGLDIIDLLKSYPLKIDLHFYTPDEFIIAKKKPFSFVQAILINGICVYKKIA